MLRYCVNLVLFTTAIIAGRQIVQTWQVTETPGLHQQQSVDDDRSEMNVAEAWRRYHEEVRRGIVCDADVPPHPAVIAAVLTIVLLRVLTKPLRHGMAA